MEVARSLGGMAFLLLIAYAVSLNRKTIRKRVVISALLAQVALGALLLFVPWGKIILSTLANGVNRVIDFGNEGIAFLFGGLVSPKMFELFGGAGFVFALRVLPQIIFVTTLLSILYYLGIMRWVVRGLGTLFHRLIGVSKAESFSAVTTIFLGQSELPALVRPFVNKLSGPELFAIMSSGMASIAGSVLAGYAGLGVKMAYLLAASVMAIPGGLLFAKIICPGEGRQDIDVNNMQFDEHRPANVIEAAASGAGLGLKIAVSVGAMLIAFVSLIALSDGAISWLLGLFGLHGVTLETLLG